MADGCTKQQDGLQILPVSVDDFREFARRHGTSREIGRIGTFLDDDKAEGGETRHHLFGLLGCGKLCAVVCCTVVGNRVGEKHTCKLDSVIVDGGIRKRGLASILVSKAFLQLVTDNGLAISKIFSYAVHPATVRLLQQMSFSTPPPRGAPISAIFIDSSNHEQFVTACKLSVQSLTNKLKLQCAFCESRDKRAKPWCQPRKT